MADPLDPAVEHARGLLRASGLDCTLPRRNDPKSAALEWACSGAMALTGSADGPPEFASGALASAASGAALALQVLAPNRGFESFDAAALLGERAAIEGLTRQGNISAGGSARLLATRRGRLALNLPRDEDWQLIPALLETNRIDLASSQDWQMLAGLVATKETDALQGRGRLMGLAIAAATPMQRPKKSICEWHHETERPTPHPPSRRLRLLDLSSLWAGPLATSLLAMAGIDVLKVESPTRPDGARQGPKAFFDLMNGNKRGCALDLHKTRDRSIVERLFDSADIVLESARPRALAQLGIKATDWVARRPGRIWASITGYGRAKEWIAFGDDAAIAAGLAWPADTKDSNPRFCADAIADPLTGLHAAVLILAQIRKERGGLLDLSLVDVAAACASIENDGLVRPVERSGEQWCVVDEGRLVPVERPRARSSNAVAPALEAPDDHLISAWTSPC